MPRQELQANTTSSPLSSVRKELSRDRRALLPGESYEGSVIHLLVQHSLHNQILNDAAEDLHLELSLALKAPPPTESLRANHQEESDWIKHCRAEARSYGAPDLRAARILTLLVDHLPDRDSQTATLESALATLPKSPDPSPLKGWLHFQIGLRQLTEDLSSACQHLQVALNEANRLHETNGPVQQVAEFAAHRLNRKFQDDASSKKHFLPLASPSLPTNSLLKGVPTALVAAFKASNKQLVGFHELGALFGDATGELFDPPTTDNLKIDTVRKLIEGCTALSCLDPRRISILIGTTQAAIAIGELDKVVPLAIKIKAAAEQEGRRQPQISGLGVELIRRLFDEWHLASGQTNLPLENPVCERNGTEVPTSSVVGCAFHLTKLFNIHEEVGYLVRLKQLETLPCALASQKEIYLTHATELVKFCEGRFPTPGRILHLPNALASQAWGFVRTKRCYEALNASERGLKLLYNVVETVTEPQRELEARLHLVTALAANLEGDDETTLAHYGCLKEILTKITRDPRIDREKLSGWLSETISTLAPVRTKGDWFRLSAILHSGRGGGE